ncbi:uncharacterized protein NDAI_0G00490 [Naumovozyma dairenensis CBS 421]|uniref:Major facilitator superfamily (MFS) profile domain-containing protein n=1 Tax=Naumovozyma dairenensis (strain ATCC 10597 / BCRC 20456 / CBS 421 / NBRC 0211 / NRRL Y-12639) TaxID=1071378 RepID=G0WDG4_NAUDC|nr:hypothetical protein NDAI_0G00490 [Naumovozyma dairenensis CBS 421]CCD25825.2 hypothetical protein NDAI_0G00490 [Naumovozyma dairenensis CBS 421]
MARSKLTFKQQMDGFPWAQLLAVSLVRFSEPIAFSSLFPYVYFMVKDFHITPDDADVAKYSGYLSSTFAFCQVLSAFHWGKFSESHGRKITLQLGLIGTSISLLILGFSRNFTEAFIARSLMGLLNGNVGVIRTMIGEIATQRKHQALAFSTMPLLFQFGTVMGPLLGGFLVFRNANDNDVVPSWFPLSIKKLIDIYPYCLPNLFLVGLLMLGLVNSTLFLEETHPTYKFRKDYGIETGDFIKKRIFGITPKVRPWNVVPENESDIEHMPDIESQSATEMTPLIDDDDDDSDVESVQSLGHVLTRRESVGLIRTYSLHEPTDIPLESLHLASDGCSENSMRHHLLHTDVFYPISVAFIMSLHLIVYNEFLPVFLAYDLAKDPQDPTKLASKFPWKITGGIGYQPEQTGTLLSTTGIFGCFVVIFIFPIVDRSFDCLTIFRTLVKLYPLIYFMIPYVVFLQNDNVPQWCTIVYLYVITGLKTLCGALSSPQIMLLIHNSSPLHCRAIVNGATISIQSSARFLGPLIMGYIMSWAQKHNVAWVSWWSLSLFCIIALYQSYKIKPIDENDEIETEAITTNTDATGSFTGPSRQILTHRSSLGSLSNKRG